MARALRVENLARLIEEMLGWPATDSVRAVHVPGSTTHSAQTLDQARIRGEAQRQYQAAVNRVVGTVEAEILLEQRREETEKKRRARRRHVLEAAALLLLLVGVKTYRSTREKLARLMRFSLAAVPGTPEAEAVTLEPARGEAQEFGEERAVLLEQFPKTIMDRLGKLASELSGKGMTWQEVADAVHDEARRAEAGQGSVVADTEAQATYGSAQVRLLKQAGFKTVLWSQLERPTKRATHAVNMALGPKPLGHLYPNGQRYPGDPAGGAGECVNCLCQLVGVDRK